MKFLDDMKQRMADRKAEKEARKAHAQIEKKEDPVIDVSRQGEPVKRINKFLVFGITGVLVIGAMWFLTSPSDSGPKKPKEDDNAKTVQTELITDKTVQDANAKAVRDTAKNGPKNPNAVRTQNGQTGQNSTYRPAQSSSGSSSVNRSQYQSGNSSSYRNSGAAASASMAPQVPQMTQEEKWEAEEANARHKRAMKEEETQYNEDQQSRKSQIFFSFEDDSRTKKDTKKSNSSPANDYYNSLPDEGAVIDDRGDYIQVVSGSGRGK